MLTDEQITNLESHAKTMIESQKAIKQNLDNLIREAQKLGYSVNPKTGKVSKLIL